MICGWLRLSRSGSPLTSRRWSAKRAPRKSSAERPRPCSSTPQEPSSTTMRSLRSRSSSEVLSATPASVPPKEGSRTGARALGAGSLGVFYPGRQAALSKHSRSRNPSRAGLSDTPAGPREEPRRLAVCDGLLVLRDRRPVLLRVVDHNVLAVRPRVGGLGRVDVEGVLAVTAVDRVDLLVGREDVDVVVAGA